MQSKFSQNSVKIQSKFSQNSVKIQSIYSQNAAKIQSKCSQNSVKIQSKCSQNAVFDQFRTFFNQNQAILSSFYFRIFTRCQLSCSGMLAKQFCYFRIGNYPRNPMGHFLDTHETFSTWDASKWNFHALPNKGLISHFQISANQTRDIFPQITFLLTGTPRRFF